MPPEHKKHLAASGARFRSGLEVELALAILIEHAIASWPAAADVHPVRGHHDHRSWPEVPGRCHVRTGVNLIGSRRSRWQLTVGRPVVLSEHECGEVDFMGQLEQAFQCRGSGLKDVVHGSTCATSSRPRASACSSFSCFPDESTKMRGLVIHSSLQQIARAVPMMPPDRGVEETADGTPDCPGLAVGQKGADYVRTAYRASGPIRIRAGRESR